MHNYAKVSASSDSDNSLGQVWREIYAKLQRRARQLCKGDTHRADELLSDTALKVHLHMSHSGDHIRNLAGFMFLALNHAFLDHIRRQGRENKVFDHNCECDEDYIAEQAGNGPSPEQELVLKQQLSCMSQAVASLNPDQQTLFALKFEQDLPYPQIATKLGINEALARKRVELLRKQLRRQLA
ncbi:RNA polymerase sigma factor [Chitinimonas sp. PSY-7]|uniref:sigma-70 family RNA polymerase sigma factor n=1 Tax=Chitinimonas sp. PSY-7 TaxID=3459088 RepID=UPI0040400A3C